MYPYLRLASTLFSARCKPRLSMWDTTDMKLRVWPTDLDPYLELNNGRYLTLMEMGRWELAERCGLIKQVKKHKWGFVVGGASIRYRRRLTAFQAFTLTTQLIAMDERWFYFDQRVYRNEQQYTGALFRGGVLDKSGLVSTEKVCELMGAEWRPGLPNWVKSWTESDDMRAWDRPQI